MRWEDIMIARVAAAVAALSFAAAVPAGAQTYPDRIIKMIVPAPAGGQTDVLARLPDHSAKRIHELLPWNWHRQHVAAEDA